MTRTTYHAKLIGELQWEKLMGNPNEYKPTDIFKGVDNEYQSFVDYLKNNDKNDNDGIESYRII